MQGVVVGYRSYVSTKGAAWNIYHVMREFNDYERRQGSCDGMAVETYWVDKFIPCELNKPVDLNFEPGNDGKARLVGIRSKEVAKNA